MSLWKHFTVVVICLITCQPATAAKYVVEVPQLVGLPGTAPYTVVDVNQQLPTAFSQIESGALRLTGEHFPGTVTDIFTHVQKPIGATLQLENPSPDSPFTSFPYFQYRLAHNLHGFSLEIPIGVAYQLIPDFKQWLDGTAEFTFSVGPPTLLVTAGVGPYPLVRIDHAELVLMGEPIGVPEPTTAALAGAAIMMNALIRFRRLATPACHWLRQC